MIKKIAENKRACYDFEILETYEAGIMLKGDEVKSLRKGRISIQDAFARVEDGEVFLYHLHIPPYQPASMLASPPERRRKLLLRKQEIRRIEGKLTRRGLTLIPLKVYFKDAWVKVELGLARAKKKFEKREILKRKDLERETARYLKEKRVL